MAIQVTINKNVVDALGGPTESEAPDIVVDIKGAFLKIKLNARKTLDGNIIIYDHKHLDIIIIPFKNKILTLPKKNRSTDSFYVQKRYFDFLKNKGVIVYDSVRGGSVYGSLEAFYPVNKQVDALQVVLLVTKRFLEQDKNKYQTFDEYQEDVDNMFLEPEDDDSTELGEVPHSEEKGTIDPNFKPYGILYRI
jgi:hypothetical protein